MPGSGTAEQYATSSFSFLRNIHTLFNSSSTNSQSYQQWRRVPFSAQPLLLTDFAMRTILTNVKWYLLIVCSESPQSLVMLSKMNFEKRRSNSTTTLLKLLLYFPNIFHIRPNPFIACSPHSSLIAFHWSALCTLSFHCIEHFSFLEYMDVPL